MAATSLPKIAGILDIISGSIGLIIAFAFFSIGSAPWETSSVYPVAAWFFVIIGVLAILGGICALGREIWGLALAGSIAALLPCSPLGVAAIILIAIAKKEF